MSISVRRYELWCSVIDMRLGKCLIIIVINNNIHLGENMDTWTQWKIQGHIHREEYTDIYIEKNIRTHT